MVEQVLKRQIAAEEGREPPIAMFAEGCTTNGTSIIKFKKGAFGALRKVKPYVQTFWSLTGITPAHGDAISMLGFINVLVHCGISFNHIQELPVFEPNEYFWKNHWQEGKEEKWEAFARVMQQIMAEKGGFKISDNTSDQKVAYKYLVRGKKIPDKSKVKSD